MPASINKEKIIKKTSLRYTEYYHIQDTFDDLYCRSKKGENFYDLMKVITDERNIKLAYRNIKSNSGSITPGTNGRTIDNIRSKSDGEFLRYVKDRFTNYIPLQVRRVEIPKSNGKTRPLGIPNIEDRIIQQCIKQVLEPICEAKFYHSNYGFRPNRSCKDAIAALTFKINRSELYYVVDVDIKGFFDNVNHGKLLKQLWTIGIRDKKLISIISQMLKAEIQGIGIPTKGTPQGGILSPLLANIVLNELDWWIGSQWREMKCNIKPTKMKNGTFTRNNQFKVFRVKSTLKEIYIVRYADDFKLICATKDNAEKIYIATKNWLKERLFLDISEEKSGIVDVRTHSTEFLGIRLKAKLKKNRFVVHSHMSEKAIKSANELLIERVKEIQKHPNPSTVGLYNATVLGIQNYYKMASHINLNLGRIAYRVDKVIYNRLRHVYSTKGKPSETYEKYYKGYNFKLLYIAKCVLFPIHACKTKTPMQYDQTICDYTVEGRKKIHDKLKMDTRIMSYLIMNANPHETVEFNDCRIARYAGQNGKCGITGEYLEIGDMELHHALRRCDGGLDVYSNLLWVTTNVHKLIHATVIETIEKYYNMYEWDENTLKKLNKFRKMAGNFEISVS